LKTPAHPFTLAALAKLNLRLEVGPLHGRLHTIVSVIAELALADELEFAPSSDGFHVKCDVADLREQENLAWRAVQALGLPLPPVSITIVKHIPMQAGLGGGSADAAAALFGIERICKEQGLFLTQQQIAHEALETGSYVASFLTLGLKR
jgi:4-diphosphocytidyl-2-C-methyl-D-erythritol kinase